MGGSDANAYDVACPELDEGRSPERWWPKGLALNFLRKSPTVKAIAAEIIHQLSCDPKPGYKGILNFE
ncbi:MAG: hypothetical protein F6J93_34620 [Oscillatoria sp. SIO1A7]|nr:hypothetical protein [Oscillatoria sp. SIO1A7]